MSPEAAAREQIDAQHLASGWTVQNCKGVDFSAGRGIALCEVRLTPGTLPFLYESTGVETLLRDERNHFSAA